jgi:hypothetical protein
MQIELQFMPVSTEVGASILENDNPVVGWEWCRSFIGGPDFGSGKYASAVFPAVDDLQITIQQSSELSLRAVRHAPLPGLWGLQIAEAAFDVLSAPNLPDDTLTIACRFCGEPGSLAA